MLILQKLLMKNNFTGVNPLQAVLHPVEVEEGNALRREKNCVCDSFNLLLLKATSGIDLCCFLTIKQPEHQLEMSFFSQSAADLKSELHCKKSGPVGVISSLKNSTGTSSQVSLCLP